MEDRPRIETASSNLRPARTSVTHERIRQLAGDADEPHPHDRAARLPLAKAWLPLHNYFRW